MSLRTPNSPDKSCQEPVNTARRHQQFPDAPISSLNEVISRNRQEARKGTANPQLNVGVRL